MFWRFFMISVVVTCFQSLFSIVTSNLLQELKSLKYNARSKCFECTNQRLWIFWLFSTYLIWKFLKKWQFNLGNTSISILAGQAFLIASIKLCCLLSGHKAGSNYSTWEINVLQSGISVTGLLLIAILALSTVSVSEITSFTTIILFLYYRCYSIRLKVHC